MKRLVLVIVFGGLLALPASSVPNSLLLSLSKPNRGGASRCF
jgi:hypothetical protein